MPITRIFVFALAFLLAVVLANDDSMNESVTSESELAPTCILKERLLLEKPTLSSDEFSCLTLELEELISAAEVPPEEIAAAMKPISPLVFGGVTATGSKTRAIVQMWEHKHEELIERSQNLLSDGEGVPSVLLIVMSELKARRDFLGWTLCARHLLSVWKDLSTPAAAEFYSALKLDVGNWAKNLLKGTQGELLVRQSDAAVDEPPLFSYWMYLDALERDGELDGILQD